MTVASQNTLNKSKDDIPLGPLLGPKTHLALFSWCQILVYFDRGIVSGMLNNITKEVDGAHSKFLAARAARLGIDSWLHSGTAESSLLLTIELLDFSSILCVSISV